jgi:hypothetical protein
VAAAAESKEEAEPRAAEWAGALGKIAVDDDEGSAESMQSQEIIDIDAEEEEDKEVEEKVSALEIGHRNHEEGGSLTHPMNLVSENEEEDDVDAEGEEVEDSLTLNLLDESQEGVIFPSLPARDVQVHELDDEGDDEDWDDGPLPLGTSDLDIPLFDGGVVPEEIEEQEAATCDSPIVVVGDHDSFDVVEDSFSHRATSQGPSAMELLSGDGLAENDELLESEVEHDFRERDGPDGHENRNVEVSVATSVDGRSEDGVILVSDEDVVSCLDYARPCSCLMTFFAENGRC